MCLQDFASSGDLTPRFAGKTRITTPENAYELRKSGFRHGTGIVETEGSLPDRAESGSLAESTAWATKHKPIGVAQLRSIAATMLSANASGRERNG
jgi:hypothetical protein